MPFDLKVILGFIGGLIIFYIILRILYMLWWVRDLKNKIRWIPQNKQWICMFANNFYNYEKRVSLKSKEDVFERFDLKINDFEYRNISLKKLILILKKEIGLKEVKEGIETFLAELK